MKMGNILLKNVPKKILEQCGEEISYNIFLKNINKSIDKINYWSDEELENIGQTSALVSNSF